MKKDFSAVFVVFIGVIVMVAIVVPLFSILAQGQYPDPINVGTIQGLLTRIIDFAEEVVRPLSVLAILWAAFLYVSAGGDEGKVSKGHRALTYGVIGLFIVLASDFLVAALQGVADTADAAETLTDFIEEVAKLFGYFIMAASVIAVLYSAFLFLTSGSDPNQVTTARQALLYAVIGVAVAVVAFVIPGLIEQLVPQ